MEACSRAFSNRSGKAASAVLLSGAGRFSAMPCRLLEIRLQACRGESPASPCRPCCRWRFGPCVRAAPVLWPGASPSAVTLPCALKVATVSVSTLPGARGCERMPPSKRTSPPSSRAWPPATEKPRSLTVTTPLSRVSGGTSARKLHVVAGQRDGAFDAGFVDGMDGQLQAEPVVARAGRNVALASAWLVMAPTGDWLTNPSASAKRALEVQVDVDRGVVGQVRNARIGLDQLQARQAGDLAVAPFTSSAARLNTSSPLSSVRAGQAPRRPVVSIWAHRQSARCAFWRTPGTRLAPDW
jgi:hypothetical protein